MSWEGLGGVLGGLGAHFGGSVAQLGAYMADEVKKKVATPRIRTPFCRPNWHRKSAPGMPNGSKRIQNQTKMCLLGNLLSG